MASLRLSLTIILTLGWAVPAGALQSFSSVSERDLTLRHAFPLYIQHRLGDLSVQGWVQDRIRVEMKMRVLAETQEEANREFAKLNLITFESKDRFEVRVGQTQGVDLVSKMRNRQKNTVQVDLQIRAPYQSNLSVVLGEGRRMKLDQWRGSLTLAGKENILSLSEMNLGGDMTLNCLNCETEIRQSTLKGRISVGSKPVTLSGIESQGLSIDGLGEEIRIDQCSGNMAVHTKSGRLSVSRYKGRLQFQSEEGGAYLTQFSGGADIQTASGQVILDIEDLQAGLNVDTEKSDIQIGLQPDFKGGLDLKSLRGDVVVQFPYEATRQLSMNRYGPSSLGRVDGTVGNKAEPLIHAYSKQGGVRLIRKAPSK